MFSISNFPNRPDASKCISTVVRVTPCAAYAETSVTKTKQVVFRKYCPVAIIGRYFIAGYSLGLQKSAKAELVKEI